MKIVNTAVFQGLKALKVFLLVILETFFITLTSLLNSLRDFQESY